MSAINVNSITGRTGSHGPVLTGLTTVTGDLHVGGGVSFSGIGTYTNGLNVTSGSVGIGTDNPAGTLEIDTASTTDMLLLDVSGTNILDVRSEGHTRFLTGGNNERLRILSTGDVGIGTASPDNRLHVLTSSTDVAMFESTSAGAGPAITFDHSGASPADDDNIGKIVFNGKNDANESLTYADIKAISTDVSDSSEDCALTFNTRNAGSFAERVRITSSGDVGIGSDNPAAKLKVVNSNSTTPTAWIRNTSGSGDSPALRVQGGANNDNTVGTFEVRDFDGNVDFKVGGTGTVTIGNGNLVFSTSGNGIDFSATGGPDNGTGNSELLDDYEEGTWTPTITGLGDHTNNAGGTFGKYTKIGNRVFISWRYSWTNRSTTNGGVVFLASLPFSAANDSQNSSVYIGGLEGIRSNTGREVYGGQVLNNTTTIQFRASGDDVSENSLFGSLSTSMDSGYIYGGANYIV